MNSVLLEDIEKVAKSNLPFLLYRKCTFLITGATGLIGSLLIKSLLYCNQLYGLEIKIIAMIRNTEKAKKIFRDELPDTALTFLEQDLVLPMKEIKERIDYIIHAAAITKSKYMVNYPADNIILSVGGTMSILELARKMCVKGMVYISSMEVYGDLGDLEYKVTEEKLGYIDIASPRSCYPEGKRLCECLCNAYVSQYHLNIKSARLAQTFGPGILDDEDRVFAQFARSVIFSQNIVLHTDGTSDGNYVYTVDAIIAILLLLTEGSSGNAYNITNEDNHMTIRDMAEVVAEKVAYGKIKIIYDIKSDVASKGYFPRVKLNLCADKMRELGWTPHEGIVEMYQRMIAYMISDKC
nr:NAD(P)-dependent oxidoreductase [uncultured Acetatifactor sp.]